VIDAVPRSDTGSDAQPLLLHDYLLVYRGAERSFRAITDCWPKAPIATLVYDPEVTETILPGRTIRASVLQHLHLTQRSFRRLLPLFPWAVERIPVSGFDLIISSSSAFAHGIHPDPGAVHVCYCYTPFRYAWFEQERALAEAGRLTRPALRAALGRIRRWDLQASSRVTHYVAISEFCRERIAQTYGRDAEVVYPPVEVDRFSPGAAEDFFLIVCELVRHKRVDVALAAARAAGVRVKVVGTGPEHERLQATYGSDRIEFLGRIDDAELDRLYPRALALIVPNVEEFGIAAVEAQAAGRPVLGFAAGGVKETVVDGETGVLVERAEPEAFAEVLSQVDFTRFEAVAAVRNAQRFSAQTFAERFRGVVEGCVSAPAIPDQAARRS
jgi:glycosyltransferase involved in cell wall biosynthesis